MTTICHHRGFALMIVLAFLSFTKANAQAEVRKAVDKLFDGMRAGDSTMLKEVLLPECFLTSLSKNAADSVIVHKSGIAGFIKAVGTPHKEKWDERIYDVKISLDEPMAIVWAPYKFYLDGNFSHCGVNVFTMIHTKTGWKINSITDTRRKENCL